MFYVVFSLAKGEHVTEICDSYLTYADEEMLYCKTNLVRLKWLLKKNVSQDMYNTFAKKNVDSFTSCNTDKTKVFSCENKCKTRGVVVAAFNCGIVLSFREIFGSESLTQIGLMYLDTISAYSGMY